MLESTRVVAAGLAIAIASGLLATTTAVARTTPAANDATGVLVMGEGSAQSVAGWTEQGRRRANEADGSSHGEMRHLQSIGDRLVVLGSTIEPNDGPSHHVVYRSLDGIKWRPAAIPTKKPTFTDLASTGTKVVLSGSDRLHGKRKARLWRSSDGVAWNKLPAPPGLKKIAQVVSPGTDGSPLAVRGGQKLWARKDGGGWRLVTKLIDMSILHGPGGFLASQFPNRVLLHWDDDLKSLREVPLPKAMGRNPNLLADAQLFALKDEWLLVPHVLTNPHTIYASSDGLKWKKIPRPPKIVAGAVRWMTDVDAEVQAFGAIDHDHGDRAGIWTFVPGDPVAKAAKMAGSDEFIDAPVAFGDDYAAIGLKMGRAWRLTSWTKSSQ